MSRNHDQLFASLQKRVASGLPGRLGIEIQSIGERALVTRMEIRPEHLAANGYLHAGSVVTLADTACGFGCIANLPEKASNFTTVELKSNFLGTATAGTLVGAASLIHAGRSTQVWDAVVYALPHAAEAEQIEIAPEDPETGTMRRTLALFRCTQMILY